MAAGGLEVACLADTPGAEWYLVSWRNNRVLLDAPLPAAIRDPPQVLNTVVGSSQTPKATPAEADRWAQDPFALLPEQGVDLATVDVILISHHHRMHGLPYLTERHGFEGEIYASAPTKQLGHFLLRAQALAEESASSTASSVGGKPGRCTPDEVEKCFERIHSVSYGERCHLTDNLTVEALPSGFCLGSCNWLLSDGVQRIAYVGASGLSSVRHPMPLARQPLVGVDVLILHEVALHGSSPAQGMREAFECIGTCLLHGGTVLCPVHVSGLVYDILGALLDYLQQAGVETQAFFVGPFAKASLSFAGIYSNWLCEKKRDRVFAPAWPFDHQDLIASGKLLTCTSASDPILAQHFKPGSIVFADHPSLRFGDIVHFINMLGGHQANLLVGIEADYDIRETSAPFQPMAAQVVNFKLDPRLSVPEAVALVKDVNPGHLLVPHAVAQAMTSLPSAIQERVTCLEAGMAYVIGSGTSMTRALLAPELAAQVPTAEGASAPVTAVLTGQDYHYRLECEQGQPLMENAAPGAWMARPLLNRLLQAIAMHGLFDARLEAVGETHVLHVRGASITLTPQETLVRVPSLDKDGQLLQILRHCVALSLVSL